MNLEALPKYYSPKSPKLSDDAPATGSGGLTITDVMAAQGMVQSKAPLGFALFLAKVGVQDPQFAIEGLLNYAMALDNPTLNKLSEETRLQIIPYLVNFAFADYSRSAASKARCEHCAGTGFHNVLREVVKHSRSGESVIKEEWVYCPRRRKRMALFFRDVSCWPTPAPGPIAVMSAVITVRQSRMNMTSRRPISRRINAANA